MRARSILSPSLAVVLLVSCGPAPAAGYEEEIRSTHDAAPGVTRRSRARPHA